MREIFLTGLIGIMAAAPTSTNYILRNYDIGSGGTSNSSSTNYRLNGVSGTQTGSSSNSSTYVVNPGLPNSQTVSVPLAPTFTNQDNTYNKLRLVLNPGTNPSDTRYLIAISTDNFATVIQSVQSDGTAGTGTTIANYRTYAAWGGASGITLIGLTPSTTYTVKVKAIQGGFTNSGFGPSASAATAQTSVSMSLATTQTSSPPFPVAFSSLTPGSVVSGSADIIVGITSNAENGGEVYIRSSNAGLSSTLASSTISSVTADLASSLNGYGAQVITTGQSSGGPFIAQAPFSSSADNVGGLTTNLQKILSTSSKVSGATANVRLKAKASNTTPSSSDYQDQLTLVSSMNY